MNKRAISRHWQQWESVAAMDMGAGAQLRIDTLSAALIGLASGRVAA
jgi:hypothetical protein